MSNDARSASTKVIYVRRSEIDKYILRLEREFCFFRSYEQFLVMDAKAGTVPYLFAFLDRLTE